MTRIQRLIDILLDSNATICERDDIAMDLENYDNDLVLNALITVSKNKHDDEMVLNSCG